MPLLSEVKISCIQRSLSMCFIQNLVCFSGLQWQKRWWFRYCHTLGTFCAGKDFALITFSFKCLAQRRDFPDLNHLIQSWELNWDWKPGGVAEPHADPRSRSWWLLSCFPWGQQLSRMSLGWEEGRRSCRRILRTHVPPIPTVLQSPAPPAAPGAICFSSSAITILSWTRDL